MKRYYRPRTTGIKTIKGNDEAIFYVLLDAAEEVEGFHTPAPKVAYVQRHIKRGNMSLVVNH